MATLRELLLAIKIKVDQSAIAQTDAAFSHATQSAEAFERQTNRAAQAVKKVGDQLKNNLGFQPAARQAPTFKAPRPPSPSDKIASATNLLPPNIADFVDKRNKVQQALDAVGSKFRGVFSGTVSAVKRADAAVSGLVGRLLDLRLAAGAFVATIVGSAVGRAIGDVVNLGGALHDASKRTRLSVESLQVWNKVAELAGADAGAVETGFRKLSRSMAAAARGSKLQAAAFEELNAPVKNADGSLRPLEDVMIDVGSAISGLEDDAKATALATQILGPAGLALIPVFQDGADAVRKQTAAMRENVAINAQEAARLDALGDSVSNIGSKWKALKARAVVTLLPVLEFVIGKFEKLSKWLLETAKSTKALQTIGLALASGALAKLVMMTGAWIARVGGARAALALLAGGLRTAAGFALRFIAPLLIIEDFLVFLAGGKSVFGRAFEEIFGSGGAKMARQEILAFFDRVEAVVTNEIIPALKEIWPVVEGIGVILKSLLLGALNLIGMAISDDTAKTLELAQAFERNMAPAVEKVADLIQAVGRALIQLGASSAGLSLTGIGDNLKADAAGMRNSGRSIGSPRQGPSGVSGNFDEATAALVRAKLSSPVPPPSVPKGGAAAGGKTVTLNDHRKVSISVDGGKTPGAAGRAAAAGTSGALEKDRRQTLSALSG